MQVDASKAKYHVILKFTAKGFLLVADADNSDHDKKTSVTL
jgi:hypothetical protein